MFVAVDAYSQLTSQPTSIEESVQRFVSDGSGSALPEFYAFINDPAIDLDAVTQLLEGHLDSSDPKIQGTAYEHLGRCFKRSPIVRQRQRILNLLLSAYVPQDSLQGRALSGLYRDLKVDDFDAAARRKFSELLTAGQPNPGDRDKWFFILTVGRLGFSEHFDYLEHFIDADIEDQVWSDSEEGEININSFRARMARGALGSVEDIDRCFKLLGRIQRKDLHAAYMMDVAEYIRRTEIMPHVVAALAVRFSVREHEIRKPADYFMRSPAEAAAEFLRTRIEHYPFEYMRSDGYADHELDQIQAWAQKQVRWNLIWPSESDK